MLRSHEEELYAEVAQLDIDIARQKLIIEAMHRHAGEVARSYYKGERASLLSLFLDSENFNDFLLLAQFLELLFKRDMQMLETFQAERAKSVALQTIKQEKIKQIETARVYLEERLAEIIAIQKQKEANLAKITDPTTMKSLMSHLTEDWSNRGLPAFRKFFSELAVAMRDVPELATPSRFTSQSFLSHTLTIDERDFNEFLARKNELFKYAQFQFDNNQLIVSGSYDQVNLKIVGEYELVSPTELKFKITQLLFDGFELPFTTIEELEKEYNLGFYPALINPNIRVEGVSLDMQQLKLKLAFEVFGSNN